MGKISELKYELEQLEWDDPRIQKLQEEINKKEQWCVDNHPEYKITVTNWTVLLGGQSNKYPHHTGYVNIKDIGMLGELNGSGISYNFDKSIHHCEKD